MWSASQHRWFGFPALPWRLRRQAPSGKGFVRPSLEALEDRVVPSSANPAPVVPSWGQVPPCNCVLGSLSGYKYNAETNQPVPGWTIDLLEPNGTTVTDPTDSNGFYSFTNLGPGTYTVEEDPSNSPTLLNPNATGSTQTEPTTGSPPGTYQIVISSGTNSTNNNFADLPTFPTGSISGYKYNAETGSPVPGWTIDLLEPNGTTVADPTDSNGFYSFTNLGPGTYTVKEDPNNSPTLLNPSATGSTQTEPTTGSPPGTYQIVISSGTNSTNNNFADLPTFPTSSISGYKYNAETNQGVSGWWIDLYKNGTRYAQQQTVSGGFYIFTNLPPGTYTVEEDPSVANGGKNSPATLTSGATAYFQTEPTTGTPPGTYTITITSGTNSTSNDFSNMPIVPGPLPEFPSITVGHTHQLAGPVPDLANLIVASGVPSSLAANVVITGVFADPDGDGNLSNSETLVPVPSNGFATLTYPALKFGTLHVFANGSYSYTAGSPLTRTQRGLLSPVDAFGFQYEYTGNPPKGPANGGLAILLPEVNRPTLASSFSLPRMNAGQSTAAILPATFLKHASDLDVAPGSLEMFLGVTALNGQSGPSGGGTIIIPTAAGGQLTATFVTMTFSTVSGGQLTTNVLASCTYAAPKNFNGTDTFTYTVETNNQSMPLDPDQDDPTTGTVSIAVGGPPSKRIFLT
jgi:hypothetical protein